MSEVPISSTPAGRGLSAGRMLRWGLILVGIVVVVAWATGRATRPKHPPTVVDASALRGVPFQQSGSAARSDAASGDTGTATDPAIAAALRPGETPSGAVSDGLQGASSTTAATNAEPVGLIAPDGRLLPALPFGPSDAPPPPPPQPGYKSIGFAFLSDYEYQLHDRIEEEEGEELPQQIPAAVLEHDREQIAVSGFMIPIEMENRQVRSFLLVKSQLLCCFGIPPRMNEWIYCEMRLGRQAEYAQDVPVIVAGELHVGEELQDGYVMSIYRMYVDKVLHTGGY